MQFSVLYGIELDRELGSADTTQLFTTVRRKAAINAAQLEWVKRTECLQRQGSVSLVDTTQEYDLESAFGFTDFGWITKAGVSIKIVSGSTTRYIEGDGLEVTSEERLNFDEPGWRAVSAGTPRKVYLRRSGGSLLLGFHPAPDLSGTDIWTALVPYVIQPYDMTADADVPFTFSTNPIVSLTPWHRALVYYAAYDLEKFRKDAERGLLNLKLFEDEIEKFTATMKPKGGQAVRYAKQYRGRRMAGRPDPRIWP